MFVSHLPRYVDMLTAAAIAGLWQSAALTFVAYSGLHFMQRASASLRHAFLFLLFITAAALPWIRSYNPVSAMPVQHKVILSTVGRGADCSLMANDDRLPRRSALVGVEATKYDPPKRCATLPWRGKIPATGSTRAVLCVLA